MKVMLSTSAKVDETFENLLGKVKQEMEQQHDFASAMHSFQEQLIHDLETTSQSGQNHISALTTAVGSSLQSMLKALAFASEDLQINMNDIGHVSSRRNTRSYTAHPLQNMKAISEQSWNINKSIARIFEQILQGSSELAVLRKKELEASKALSMDLQESLQSIRDEDLADISIFLRNMRHDLVRKPTPSVSGFRLNGSSSFQAKS